MAEAKSTQRRSFGRLVLGEALSGAGQFLKYTRRDIVLGCITLLLGGALAYVFVGKVDTVKEIAFIAVFTIAPAGIVMFAVFIWFLWLAPSALAYEAVKAADARTQIVNSPTGERPQINWAPWKHRAQYSLYEFAKILSKTDPAAQSMSTEGSAFARLLLEDVEGKKLKYVPRFRVSDFNGRKYELSIDYESEVAREDAIAWAEKKQFPIDHVR